MNGLPHQAAANRRVSPRAALRGPARIVIGDQTLSVETCDLSRDGVGFIVSRPLSPGRRGELTFTLPTGGGEPSVTAAVKITHSTYLARERFQIGASFVALGPEAAEAIGAFLDAG